MAIDAAIPLQVQPVHIDSPVESQSKVLGLKSMQNQIAAQQQEAELRQQATQENSLKLAAAKRTQAGIDAQSAAIQAAIETDQETGEKIVNHKKVASTLEQAGFPELSDSYLQHADAVSTSETSLIQKRAALRQASADLIGEHAMSLQAMARDPNVSDADLQSALVTRAGHAAASGLLTEQDARAFIAKAQGAPSREALAIQLDQFVTPNVRQRAATLQKTTAEAEEAAAKAKLANAKATPPSAAKYQAQIDDAIPLTDKANAALRTRTISAVTNARTVEDADKAIDEMRKQLGQIDVAKNTVPAKIAVAVGSQEGKDAAYARLYEPKIDAGGNPKIDPMVKAIAEYKQAPPSPRSIASGAGRALMDQVLEYNPSYDGTQYQTRQRTRTAYVTGTEGQQINGINTAIMHMDLLADAAEALKNGNFKPGNEVWNRVKSTFGAAAPNNYETIKEFLDGEVGSVVKKGIATDGEMNRLGAKAGSSSSPEVLRDYIKNSIHLLAGKGVVLDDKYHQVMGEKDPFTILSPRSKAVLQKHGFDPDNLAPGSKPPSAGKKIVVKDPNGVDHPFDTQAQADAFTALIAQHKKDD